MYARGYYYFRRNTMENIDSKKKLREFVQALGKVTSVSELFISSDSVVFILNESGRVILTWDLRADTNMFNDNHIAFHELSKEERWNVYYLLSSYRMDKVLRDLRISVKYLVDTYECSVCGRELDIHMAQCFDKYNEDFLCVACGMRTKSSDLSYLSKSAYYDLITVIVKLVDNKQDYRYSVMVDKKLNNTTTYAINEVSSYLLAKGLNIESVKTDNKVFDRVKDEEIAVKVGKDYVKGSLKEAFAYTEIKLGRKIIGYPIQEVNK